MRTAQIDIDAVDVDTNLVAETQKPTTAGNLTLTGSALDYARQLLITSDGNDSGRAFVITGLDADGVTQTETINGVNMTTESTKLSLQRS